MIRPATSIDIDGAVNCLERAWYATEHKQWPLDLEVLRRQVASLVNNRAEFTWVSIQDGKVVGVLFGDMAPILGTRLKAATSTAWYCEHPRDAVALVARLEKWAFAKGCASVEMSVSSGKEKALMADNVLRSLGYSYMGGNHEKRLDNNG